MVCLTRRAAIACLLRAASATGASVLMASVARGGSDCATPESESLRHSLNYVVPSPDPKQQCHLCSFFTASDQAAGCGQCIILSTPVDATGHCSSWASRAEA